MKDYVLGFVAGLILGFAVSYANAAPLTPEQARGIYAVAYGQCPSMSGMQDGCPPEWLQQMPTIHVVSSEKLCDLAVGKPQCSVLGMYQSDNVYILDTLDFETVWAASILLHEYIHHFQQLKSGPAYDCETWLAYETQAYMIQAQVLQKAGEYMTARAVMISMRQMPRCTEQ